MKVDAIDAVEMAKTLYELRNSGMKWSKLTCSEKIHIAVLAERLACMKVCREESLLAFERGYPETALKVAANCVEKIRERGVR